MEDLRKAYELRGRASERERFAIESTYQLTVNLDSEAARQIYETWMQTYPRDDLPAFNLANIYALLGEYEKMLALKQQSLKLDPNNPTSYWGLVTAYLHLNRLDEARATLEEARARKFEAANLHTGLYLLAFIQNDTVTMEQELAYLTKEPRLAKYPVFLQTQTAWSKGQLAKVKELLDQSLQDPKEQNKVSVSGDQAMMALTAALIGNSTSAKLEAEEALKTSDDKYVQATAAIALALVGEFTKAASLADDLEHRFPLNTSLKFHYLPMIRGAAALHTSVDRSIEILATSERYDLGMPPQSGHFPITLFTAYLRGLAHLQARHAELARLNFQKIIDHPGPSRHNPVGPLAHLGLARAYAIAGNAEESKTAYQNFFALWKDADPDIPILKKAQSEYEKLKLAK
jgi:tetratricopeptide (TPR) repeat protein